MKLVKLKLRNYRCFGSKEQEIDIDDMTAFIGNNSTGKTAALSALNCLFSANSGDHILKRSDFHLPKDIRPENLEKQDLYIETDFKFDELLENNDKGKYSVPIFFQSMVIDGPDATPYLRIRLEASWEKSNNIDGAIESKIYYITCPNESDIPENKKIPANRKDLDHIRVLYVPAVRDPSKQLRNVSGTMIYPIMNSINWSDETKNNVQTKIKELNDQFMQEIGVSILSNSIHTQWKTYDSDIRYSNAQLRFNSTDIDSSIKKSEVVFLPTETGKEYTIDEMGDGLKSMFYISLVDSILDVEVKIQQEFETRPLHTSFKRRPPILTIIALEEPENHIAPHLIGKLIENLNRIAKKSNAQTVLTSHAPAIVRRLDPGNLRYFRIEPDDCTTRVRRITLPDKEKYTDQYKYIKEAVKAYPELYFAKLVILCEGDSEEVLLPKFWEAKNGSTDSSGISVVPLGGRHVNHFWRLLNDLKIPYVTLLDLDRERDGGGWGRIKYVLNQLLKIGCDRSKLLTTNKGEMSQKELDGMNNWNTNDAKCMQRWMDLLEGYHVYFSAPLDIDFLMLEYYGDIYKSLIERKEGPRFMLNQGGTRKQKLVADAEKEKMTADFARRIKEGVHSALKECGGKGDTYTSEQKRLMIWYSYFFLQRGKPTTHIEAISRMTTSELLGNIPPVISKLINDASTMLSGENK
ncbi:MAG TPA: ATP-dependent endonuclease [Lachnospiraceae bacterium]|nr:ATP-dependent endonuclease [Lachnospiraceae bacterium]